MKRYINTGDLTQLSDGRIDWHASVGNVVRFVYDDVEGSVVIKAYDSDRLYLLVDYNGSQTSIPLSSFKKGMLGNVISKIQKEHRFTPGDVFLTPHGSMTILAKESRKDKRGWNVRTYRCRCNQCGTESVKREGAILDGKGCAKCAKILTSELNSFVSQRPDLVHLFQHPEEASTTSTHSNRKVTVVCPECQLAHKVIASKLSERGLRCPYCGDGISIPEKFCAEFLRQVGKQKKFAFERQKQFNWSKPFRYDFYIPSLKLIVEVHGIQHYEDGFKFEGKRNEKENDRRKRALAEENGLRFYEIDCRFSTLKILRAGVESFIDACPEFNGIKIDYEKCMAIALKSVVVQCAELFKVGLSRSEIASEMSLGKTTISRYLQRATEIGLCEYNPKEEMKKSQKRASMKTQKAVRCVQTGQIFPTLTEAAKWCGIGVTSISSFLSRKGKIKRSAGKHPETHEKLTWELV